MAISIDWGTRVIFIPKADLTLIQTSPTEIRELDLNTFHYVLKDLEDSEDGMMFPDTHTNVPGVSVGGVTLARIIEIINDYTVTFEDGQYAVNLVGANSNVGDRVNVNQVSVRSANSAGLVQTREIEHASFNGGVTIDQDHGYVGTAYPTGTDRRPVNNLGDALLIAATRGFDTYYVRHDLTISGAYNFDGCTFIGESATNTLITLDPSVSISECEFHNAEVTGTLDGNSIIRDCVITNLYYVNGIVYNTMLNPGTIQLGGGPSNAAHFLSCYSGVPGLSTPIIDCGGNGPALGIRNFSGGIKLTNKTGTSPVSIDINTGQLILDSTVTNGTIAVRGIVELTDNSTGSAVVNQQAVIDLEEIADAVWDEDPSQHATGAKAGKLLRELFEIFGLDPTKPLVVTSTSRIVTSGLEQSIDDNAGTVTVTRI